MIVARLFDSRTVNRLQLELPEGSTAPINLEKIMLSRRRGAVSLNAGFPQVLYP